MPARRASAYLATNESYYLAWRLRILFATLGVGIKPARCLGARRFWNIVCKSRGRNKAGAFPGRAPVLEYCLGAQQGAGFGILFAT